jgi:hypothetical protein
VALCGAVPHCAALRGSCRSVCGAHLYHDRAGRQERRAVDVRVGAAEEHLEEVERVRRLQRPPAPLWHRTPFATIRSPLLCLDRRCRGRCRATMPRCARCAARGGARQRRCIDAARAAAAALRDRPSHVACTHDARTHTTHNARMQGTRTAMRLCDRGTAQPRRDGLFHRRGAAHAELSHVDVGVGVVGGIVGGHVAQDLRVVLSTVPLLDR